MEKEIFKVGISERETREQLDRIERALRQVRVCLVILILLMLPLLGPIALALYAKLTTPAMLFPLALIVIFVLYMLFKGKPEP